MNIFKWAMLMLAFTGHAAKAQYVVNGTATQLNCNCYRLTQAQIDQSGSVWNSNMIDLTEAFDFTFDVYLGSSNGGADGIAFVLQPISTSIGSSGGGLGYSGINPSLAVELDTYQNGWDPSYDHIAIMSNGVVNHGTANNLAGPIIALPTNGDIEDGQEHLLRISWNPASQIMRVYMDGFLRLEYTGDIVADIFGNDPEVFWGFTGSTGGAFNEQRFCLAIIPGMEITSPVLCAGGAVNVIDSSYSALGNVVQWEWDFGNGITSTQEDPGSITYDTPGIYYIVQRIVDAAGCDAIDSIMLTVVPVPMAAFTANTVCLGNATVFSDQSTSGNATISQWSWDFGDGTANATVAQAAHTYISSGEFEVTLTVTTTAGCADTASASVIVNPLPEAQITHSSASLEGVFSTTLGPGSTAQWTFTDTTITGDAFALTFPDSGWYSVQLVVTNAFGCTDTMDLSFYLEGRPEFIIPNVFTPNGDAINDRFEPYTFAITGANFRIFNRWGLSVHSFEGPLLPGVQWGWDGNINGGAQAAAGTYYYMVNLTGTDGKTHSLNGAVTLIR
jgi:gliding motility-associated-like protein